MKRLAARLTNNFFMLSKRRDAIGVFGRCHEDDRSFLSHRIDLRYPRASFESALQEKAKPDPALTHIDHGSGLPRVRIIGDSISIGYTLDVRDLLKGKANVHRIPTNGGPTSNGLKHIDAWLGSGKWDVIHFTDLSNLAISRRLSRPPAAVHREAANDRSANTTKVFLVRRESVKTRLGSGQRRL